MKTTLSTLLLFGIIMSACQGGEEEVATEYADTVVVNTTDNAPALIAELDGLHLNNGAKWSVDSTTHAGMQNVQTLLQNYDGEDSKDLGDKIKDELKEIIKQCRMKGEDHDQYHIILNAMLIESKAMKRGKVNDPGKLEKMVAAYFTHFEV
jgi:hypothetical protein